MQISMENAISHLIAPREVVDQVRKLVAVKEIDLPPSWAKYQLDHWLGRIKSEGGRRHGYQIDLERLYRSREGHILASYGWGPDKWSKRLFENACRQVGLWDGWSSQVSSTGRFGTGLIEHVQRALHLRLGYPRAELLDHRRRIDLGSPLGRRPVLWKHQSEAVISWIEAGHRGVIELPPRTGKTRISAAIMHELGVPALMVVPTVSLVEQTVNALIPIFGEENVIGITGGSSRMSRKKHLRMLRSMIWVATPGTADKLPGLESRALLVIDEFHHAAAKTYQSISKKATHAFYRLGLTGTHFRADGKDLMMHAVLARAVYSRSISEMVATGHLVSAKALLVRTTGQPGGHKTPDQAYRNQLIVWCADELARRRRRVLVLCFEVRHVEYLAGAINGAVGVDGRDNKRVKSVLDDLEARRIPVVVGSPVIGEGTDVPGADAMVYVTSNKSRVKVTQDVYRILTANAGKSHGVLVDFTDDHDENAIVRAAERLHIYRENGFEVRVIDPENLPQALDEVCS